jgi:ribosome-binding factor A
MARNKQRAYKREDRVGPRLRDEIARILMNEVRDDRAREVQVVQVEVTHDLRLARVFYVLLQQTQEDPEIQKVLENAAGFIRRQLAGALDLRHTPDLTFAYDSSVEYGRHMEGLLAAIKPVPVDEEP